MANWPDVVEVRSFEKGRKEGYIEAVKKLLKKGCSVEFILNLGFSKEEIVEGIKAWDPDYTKVTAEEKNQIDKADAEMKEGIFYPEQEVWGNDITEDTKTIEIIRTLRNMHVKPGLYFGKQRSYLALKAFLFGFRMGILEKEKCRWVKEIEYKVWDELLILTEDKDYSEEEMFDKYFEVFEGVLKRDYPFFECKAGR